MDNDKQEYDSFRRLSSIGCVKSHFSYCYNDETCDKRLYLCLFSLLLLNNLLIKYNDLLYV